VLFEGLGGGSIAEVFEPPPVDPAIQRGAGGDSILE
jgi:hypothetical protein